MERAPGLYLVLTPTLEIVAASDTYLAATMTRREDVLGRALFDVFPDNPDDPTADSVRNLRASLNRVRREGVADTMAVQKYDIQRPESEGGGFEERFWSPINCPVRGPDGTLLYIIHRVEDVTEFVRLKRLGTEQQRLTEELRSRAEQTEAEVYLRAQEVSEANHRLQEANAELERLYAKTRELDQLKTRFFANVSHELRTPLTLIMGPVDRLLASDALDEEARRDLAVVARNARLLLKHVNDLLDVAKLDAGKMTPRYLETDLAELTRLVADNFVALAADRKIAFRLDAEGELRGQVDVDMFQRVLLNLLSNAFKFTPAGGVVSCHLRPDPAGERAVLEIADSGPGVPGEARETVFERFRQLDGGTSRRFGGTGLGLAIARDFVHLHEGSIRVADTPLGGALFRVELPVRARRDLVPAGPAGEAVRRERVESAIEELRNGRRTPADEPAGDPSDTSLPLILVVEDNPEMSDFIRRVLAPFCRTAAAGDGATGLRQAEALKPDLILTDVMMPGMGGDEFLHALRLREDLASIPVVVVSAKADDTRLELLRAGAADCLAKPFSREELRARVTNLVQGKRAADANRRLNAELGEKVAELRRVATELEASNKELEAFSYSVSHDLRAPLRAIDGFSRALLSKLEGGLGDEQRDWLGRVRANAQRMSQLIDDLLALSRITRAPLRRGPTDLTRIAREVEEELRRREPDRRVAVEVAEGMTALADARLVTLLLENLLGNAWKFTARRSTGRISVRCRRDDGETVYCVEDDGAGFDMAHADRLFAPFQRLHSPEEFEGTGIGLATVQRIVSRHGGRVWAEAAVGRGATVFFTLEGSATLHRGIPAGRVSP